MQNAIIYARYSSHSQNEQSIDTQIKICREYARQNGYVIVHEYIDEAFTATDDKRPAFQQMLHDSSSKQFEVVLVYKFDRFSRNVYQFASHEYKLSKLGVQIISACEAISDDPSGKLHKHILMGFNEFYSNNLSQNIK